VDKDRTVIARPVAPPQKPQQPQQPQKPPPRKDSTAERTVVTRPVPPPEPKQRSSYTEETTKRIQVPEPPRAAPVRIEPAQPKPKADPPKAKADPPTPKAEPKAQPKAEAEADGPKPGRSRKKLALIGGAIVLVLALAGGALAIPGVRAKLGFTSAEPDVAIQPPPSPVAFHPTLRGPSADAPTPTPEGVRSALAGPASAAALGTFNGIVIDPATGNKLWDQRATTPITPASTAKILTSAAALLKMDRGTQFATRVVAGNEPGSVVLVGGGDPTVSSLPAGKNSVYPGAAHLDDLVAQVKASGTKVTTVYFDTSRYAGDGLAQGWLPGDVQGGYITPIVPMMMDGDRRNPTEVDTPRTNTPARNIAAELAKRLGASLAPKPEAVATPDARVLGEIRSAPLAELIDNYLQISDNVLAETVARELAKSVGEEPSFAGVTRTTLKVLQDNGFDTTGVKLIDGSGLSTVDVVTPTLLGSILAVAAAPDGGKNPLTAKLRPLLGGLPVAGGSGTLEGRFGPSAPGAGGRGWVRAKTGTLSGVNSLAGVVLDADGRVLVFSMMTSGTDAAGARPALDAVAATLRGCGCK
jgi:D-alanyl-D-alanine carboxypeptidase